MVPLHTVAAFTSTPWGGNMAGVCLLDAPAPEAWMQRVAANMNLSETAFIHPLSEAWGLRWFTPAREVPLCGHATLAAAHVLAGERLAPQGRPIAFETRSGRLTCTPAGAGFRMDFPSDSHAPRPDVPGLWEALGARGTLVGETRRNRNLLVLLRDEAAVQALRPDLAALRDLSPDWGHIVTAPAADGDGYVCRYFAPAWGIDEDPATGSIQCTLGPYWAKQLGVPGPLRCRQLSARGAGMRVEARGDRVVLEGEAVVVLRGSLDAAAAPPRTVTA